MSIVAAQASYTRMSKKTTGKHPVPCPKPAFKFRNTIKLRRNGEVLYERKNTSKGAVSL